MRRWVICAVCIIAAAVLNAFTRTAPSLILLCTSVFVPAASVILALFSVPGIYVTLEVPVVMRKGSLTRCVLTVENRSMIPVAHIGMNLGIRNNLTGQEEYIPLDISASPGEKYELPFDFDSTFCGQFRFSCNDVRVYDFLRLYGFKKAQAAQMKRLMPPETFLMEISLLGNDSSLSGNEVFTVDRKGQDHTEPFQIRDYVEGDSIKSIHWKLSNKFDKYIVSDPSLELERSLLLIWDSGAIPADAPPEVPDALAEAFVSVCLALTGDDVPYSIAWQSADSDEIVIRDINVIDDVYDSIPEIMYMSSGEQRHSMITEFLQVSGMRRFPTIVYFTGQVPAELDTLAQIGRITVFLCGTDAGAADDGAHNYQIFSPANYTSILRNVKI